MKFLLEGDGPLSTLALPLPDEKVRRFRAERCCYVPLCAAQVLLCAAVCYSALPRSAVLVNCADKITPRAHEVNRQWVAHAEHIDGSDEWL